MKKALIDSTDFSRDDLKKAIKGDLHMILETVYELIHDPGLNDAVTEVYWKRYCLQKEKAQFEPELPLGKEADNDGL